MSQVNFSVEHIIDTGTVYTPGSEEFGRKDTGPGWYVVIDRLVVPMAFARKVDAEVGMKSIQGIIDWSGTREEKFSRLQEYGLQRFRERLTERLAW